MKAKVGDFLVVKGTTTERHDQHAEIIEVRAQDGSPPWELSESDSGDAPFKYYLRDFEHGHTYALMTTDLDGPVQDVRLRKLD